MAARSILVGLLPLVACQSGTDVRELNDPPDAGAPDAETAYGSLDLQAQWISERLHSSGTRLRARLLDGGGGAVVFQGFRDTELNIDCEAEVAGDGVMRCLPTGPAVTFYFADTQCTKPVFVDTATSSGRCPKQPTAAYARSWGGGPDECFGSFRARAYRVGALKPSDWVYTLTNGTCEPARFATCVRELAPERPETFVGSQLQTESIGAGLALRWRDYEDGARNVAALLDTARDVECDRNDPYSRISDRCVPVSSAHFANDSVHVDASCGGGVVAEDSFAQRCTPPNIAIQWTQRECDYERSLFEVKGRLDAAYMLTDASCAELQPGPYSTFFEVGEPLDIAKLPALLAAHGGTGRLRSNYAASALGRPVRTEPRFFDSVLNHDCTPTRFADGQLRCIPDELTTDLRTDGPFADAQCSSQLAAHVPPSDECAATQPPTLGIVKTPDGHPATLYKLIQHDIQEVYHREADACVSQTAQDGARYYAPGDKADLATLRERVE